MLILEQEKHVDGGLKSPKLYLGPCCRLERSWGSIKEVSGIASFQWPSHPCVLTIFSSLCLNGNSAVGIVSSTSILDIKTAMTKKKMVLQNSEDFFCNFLQFGVPLNGLRTSIFCFSKLCDFFPGFEVDNGDYWKPGYCSSSLSMGSETWHMCTEPPSQTYIISDIHPSQEHLETNSMM